MSRPSAGASVRRADAVSDTDGRWQTHAMARIELPDELATQLREEFSGRGLRLELSSIVEELVVGHLKRSAHDGFAIDGLTKCPTIHKFRHDLHRATWGSSWGDRSMFREQYLCFDLRNFKAFLDLVSMSAGDQVLKELAGELRGSYGAEDVYRHGGDEFLVVLRGRDVWVPPVHENVTLTFATVNVDVQRNQRRNAELNDWILQHIGAGVLAAQVNGANVECRTPSWLASP